MKKRFFITIICLLGLLLIGAAIGTVHINNVNKKNGTPQTGERYEVIGPVYFYGVYRNLNKRELNSELASGYVAAVGVSGPEVAFREVVPVGTVVTIVGAAPKIWYLPFIPNRYFAELDPDPSRGLEVVFSLGGFMEGNLDGLNPKLFRKLPRAENTTDNAEHPADAPTEPPK